MSRITFGAATAASVALAGAVQAGTVVVDGLGGAVSMQSKEIAGVFGASSPSFTRDALGAIHDDLHAGGITTDGLVTFILADTDAGLAFVTLVDDDTIGDGAAEYDSQLGMTTTAPDTGVRFINDVADDIDLFYEPGNGTKTAAGEFTWDSTRYGDGFAWAELEEGDFVSFNFTKDGSEYASFPGLESEDTFQFLSWNGEAWEVLATGEFSVNDQFAFSFTVIPLPAPVAMGLAGLVGVGVIRRRRMA
jgi:hypothetical protein